MKLAFITATPQNAKLGSGTFVGNAHLIANLRLLHPTVDVFTPSQPTGFMGYMVDRFRWNWGLDPQCFNNYDAVIGLDMDGYTIAHRIKPPFIAYIHGIIADEAKFERGRVRMSLELMAQAERVGVHRANMAIATSEYSRNRLAHLYNYSRNIQIVPPPIDLQAWDAAVSSVSQEANARPTVLCVGVQYPRKNVATLIRATAILRDRVPDVEVRIASKGPEWDNLCRLAQELDLNQNVTFLGYLPYEELVREYVRCHVFAYQACKKALALYLLKPWQLASQLSRVVRRLHELIQHGLQGLLATPLDPEDLASQLAEVLLSPEKSSALGKAGRVKVSEFDAPTIAKRFSQLLTKL